MNYKTHDIFTRSGHVSELSIADALAESMDEEWLYAFELHLASCRECARRVEAARAVELAMPPLRALGQGSAVIPLRPPRRRWFVPAGGVTAMVAMAAAALLVVNLPDDPSNTDADAEIVIEPPAESDDFRKRGPQFPVGSRNKNVLGFQVFVSHDETIKSVRSGTTVYEGDRLGFGLFSRGGGRSGHLMILGVDAAGEVALCFPQGEESAAEMTLTAETELLSDAVKVDATPGHERMVAVMCADPFSYDEAVAGLDGLDAADPSALPDLINGCIQQEILLKKPGGAD